MKIIKLLLILTLILTVPQTSFSQEKITDVEKTSLKFYSWMLTQLIPSPTFLNDRNDQNSGVTFAFRWQITALNISFNTNKYVSPVQFLFVNPMRKYTGSLEFFVQPELATGSMNYSGYNKIGLGVGSRINIPVKNLGEHLYVSVGGKYNFRKNEIENKNGYYGIEGGVYAIFGVFGLQVNYNFDRNTRYNVSLYFKYW